MTTRVLITTAAALLALAATPSLAVANGGGAGGVGGGQLPSEPQERPPYNCGGCTSNTNNVHTDTDNDGLQAWEENGRTPRLDPLNPDMDSDGLKDGQEVKTAHREPAAHFSARMLRWRIAKRYQRGRYHRRPRVRFFYTSPVDIDTDDDMVSDRIELERGSHPNVKDTDLDGVSDHDELWVHWSNPANKNTDGDCMDDGYEVRFKHDPRTPAAPDACRIDPHREIPQEKIDPHREPGGKPDLTPPKAPVAVG